MYIPFSESTEGNTTSNMFEYKQSFKLLISSHSEVSRGRHQNLTETLNVKINGGGGPKILLCKDRELIAEKVFIQHIDGFSHLMK